MSVYRPRKADGTFASPFWHYDFRWRGRRFHGSTGATDERAARKVEAAERASVRRAADDTTIAGGFGRFWLEKGQHEADPDTTFQRMAMLQDELGRILAALGRPLAFAAIDEDVLARLVAIRLATTTLHGRPRAPATVNREVQLLRRIMRRARIVWKKTEIELPDWKQVLLEEPDEHVVDVAVSAEAAILAEIRADYAPALRFLVMSGLRVGDVLAGEGRGPLRPDQVDFEAGVITVRVKSRKPGGRLHRVPITQPMKILLANELGHHPDAVFTYVAHATRDGRRHGRRYPISYSSFYTAFKRAAAAIGKPALRVHDLRHTAANRTLAATGDLRLTQKHLGHTRVTTTQRYTHPDIDALRAAMERAHAVAPAAPSGDGSGESAPETAPPRGRKDVS